jgi:hypothetical protein
MMGPNDDGPDRRPFRPAPISSPPAGQIPPDIGNMQPLAHLPTAPCGWSGISIDNVSMMSMMSMKRTSFGVQ